RAIDHFLRTAPGLVLALPAGQHEGEDEHEDQRAAADPDVERVLVVRRGRRAAPALLLLFPPRRSGPSLDVHPARRGLRHPRRALPVGTRFAAIHTLSHAHLPVFSGQSPTKRRLAPLPLTQTT